MGQADRYLDSLTRGKQEQARAKSAHQPAQV